MPVLELSGNFSIRSVTFTRFNLPADYSWTSMCLKLRVSTYVHIECQKDTA